MMNPISDRKKKGSTWRFGAYIVILLYLGADLYLFDGPLRQRIDAQRSRFENSPDKSQWVALVNLEPISKRQLEVAVVEHLFRRGQSLDEVSPKNMKIIRLAVLNDLVSNAVVRHYADGEKFKATPKSTSRFIKAFEAQFESPKDLENRSAAQHLDEKSRREHLARVIARKEWIESRIDHVITISDEDARAFYDENHTSGAGFTNPERFHARHIFISTVLEKGPEREALIRKLHTHLTKENGDFTAVAAEFSEDERTKKIGGDLNWFTAKRMPTDFMNALARLKPGELSAPFETDIGWHIAELIEKKAAEPLDFETLKPDIIAHLESVRRDERVEELLMRFRKRSNIQMYPDAL